MQTTSLVELPDIDWEAVHQLYIVNSWVWGMGLREYIPNIYQPRAMAQELLDSVQHAVSRPRTVSSGHITVFQKRFLFWTWYNLRLGDFGSGTALVDAPRKKKIHGKADNRS